MNFKLQLLHFNLVNGFYIWSFLYFRWLPLGQSKPIAVLCNRTVASAQVLGTLSGLPSYPAFRGACLRGASVHLDTQSGVRFYLRTFLPGCLAVWKALSAVGAQRLCSSSAGRLAWLSVRISFLGRTLRDYPQFSVKLLPAQLSDSHFSRREI